MSEAGSSRRRARRAAQADWYRAEAALGLLVVFCPLALGTVHDLAVAVAAGISLVALALTSVAILRSGEPFVVPAPGFAFVAAVAFVGFQLVPLPPALLGLLAPKTREIFEFVLGPLGRYPAWRPLSLDPPSTAREIVKAITCLAAFLSAAQIARSGRARIRLVTLLGISGLLVALIGFGHELWGASALFGVYTFKAEVTPFLTTFGNPNNVASFLLLGASALLGKVLVERDRKVATLWAIAYLATGVGVLLSLSRGGIVAFVATQLMLGAAVWQLRRDERDGLPVRARSLVVPAVVLGVVALAAYVAWDALAAEFASADSLGKLQRSKLSMWPSFLALASENLLVGIGRGAFGAAYARFADPEGGRVTYAHAENLVAQWIIDLGLPVGALLLGACAWGLAKALQRSASDPLRLGCVFAVLGVALHDLVDLGLEIGGIAVPASVAFAIVATRKEGGPTVRRRLAVALVPVLAVVAAACMARSSPTLEEDGERLAAQLGKEKAEVIAAEAVRLAERRPGDFFPHLVAARAWALESPMHADRLVAFASRAMYLNPNEPLAHRLAAQALRSIGRESQAAIEYRTAYDLHDRTVIGEIVRVFEEPEKMIAALPDRPQALAELAERLLADRRHAEAEAVARASLAGHGETVEALERLARIVRARGNLEQGLAIGTRLTGLFPERPAGLNVRVDALLGKGEFRRARELMEREGLTKFGGDPRILVHASRLRLATEDLKGCRELLKRLPPDLPLALRLEALEIESSLAEHEGQGTKALALMRQLLALTEDAGWRWRYTQLLERLGRYDEARHEADAVLVRAPGAKAMVEELKARVAARQRELEEVRRWKEKTGGGEEP